MALLDAGSIAAFVAAHAGWEVEGNELVKTFVSADFASAIGFVDQVAVRAEAANHHPDIAVSWNRVTLRLSTHSEGGVTTKDTALAAEFDELPTG